MPFTIIEPSIPAHPAAADAAEYLETVELGNLIDNEPFGTGHELDRLASEQLPAWHDPYSPKRLFAARLDGRIVGQGVYETRADAGFRAGYAVVQVLPAGRRLGIGTALLERIEAVARANGDTHLLAWTPVPPLDGEQLPSPTGFGAVPASAAPVRFALARGWRLEQVERVSRYPLPGDLEQLAERAAVAAEHSGDDYRVHHWTGATPTEWREQIAVLNTRMSTDAPSAGLEDPEDVWTAERVVQKDRESAASPRTMLTAAVEHRPTGALAGYSVLSVPAELDRPVEQWNTLVLREHRGRRLGVLLKAANLLELQRIAAGRPSVITYNAEENRPMLDVNEALGFVPIGVEGAWRKDLGEPGAASARRERSPAR